MITKTLTLRRVLLFVSFLVSALILWGAVSPESASAISVILSIRDVPAPYGVAFVRLQGGNKIYVSNPRMAAVTVLDERSHTVLSTIRVRDGASAMAFNPQTNKLYVANTQSAQGVSIINVLTDTVIKTLPNITTPTQIKVDAALKRVYVLSNNIIIVLDADTDEIINPPIIISFGPSAFEILQSPAGDRHTIYVPRGTNPPSLAVVDAKTQSEIASLALPRHGRAVVADPLTMRVYVLGYNRYITVVDANTNKVVTSFQISGEVNGDALGLAVDPQRRKLYVLFADRILILDTGTGPGVKDYPQVAIEGGATTLALHPVTHRLYVANRDNDMVQVVGNDLSSLTIDVGTEGTFTSGRNGTLRLVVTNKGRGASEGEVRVVVWLPQGLTFASPPGADWNCAAAQQVITCSNPRPIGPGEASGFRMNVAVSGQAVPFADVTAAVFNESDDNASDNQFGPLTIKTGGAGVDVAVEGTQGSVFRPGTTGTYDLRVGNVGTAATTAPVELTSILPDGTGFAGFVGAGWTCAASGQTVTCTHPTPIAPQSSRPLTISASVTDRARPESINMVNVFSDGDANTYNNWVPVNTKSVPSDSGFLISSDDGFAGPAGGAGAVAVVAGPSAGGWAVSSSPWIHIVSGSSGSGSGEVRFTADENKTGSPRSGTVTVAGLAHRLTQAARVAGPAVRYVSTADEDMSITTELNSADSRSQFYASRNSEYFDLCGLSRVWGAAIQVTSSDFSPQMFLYDSVGRLVAHSMPSYTDREGDTTTWLPGFTNVSGNNFNIGFFRFPAGEKYTLEVTADPTTQRPDVHGVFQLKVLRSLRDTTPAAKSPVRTSHTLAPIPYERANGTFYIEDYLNADLRRHYVIDMILKNVNVSGLDARMVELPELGFQMWGATKDFYSFNATGTFKTFDPPDQMTGSKYVGGGSFSGSILASDLEGEIFHNLLSRDFLLGTNVGLRCTLFGLDPYPSAPVFGPGEATGTITITRQPGCDWVACSDSSWIQITSPSSGSGSGTITYKVSRFDGPGFRLGRINISNMSVTIDQRARPRRVRRPTP
jgi:uncharacterized repeat protein (TIGR01451 family)